MVRRPDGTVVRDPGQVQEGELLEISVARGLIVARVEPPAGPQSDQPGTGQPGTGQPDTGQPNRFRSAEPGRSEP